MHPPFPDAFALQDSPPGVSNLPLHVQRGARRTTSGGFKIVWEEAHC